MTPRRLRIALWASVAVNLLVVFAIAGAVLLAPDGPRRGGGDDPRTARGGPPELAAFSRALDGPRSEELRARLRGDPVLRQGRDRIRAGRRAVVAALRAEPFDPDGLRAALAGQRQVQADLAQRGLDAFVEVVADLTPAERAAFVTALEDSLTRRRR